MQDPRIATQTAALLQQHWGISLPQERTWEDLRQALHIQLSKMLAEDFQGLVNAMYRLDVPEQQFRAAMDAPHTQAVVEQLTEAVLNRELLRAEMRIRFSSPSQPNTSI